jgi:anti-sigma factor RsiW
MSHDHGPGDENCAEIFSRLSEYLDEELDPSICEKVDAHMGGCHPCRAFLESLRRTVTALRASDPPRLPDDLRREVLESYRKLRDGTRDRRNR